MRVFPPFLSGRTECYDYLFSIAVEMRKAGLDPNWNPEEKGEQLNKLHKE